MAKFMGLGCCALVGLFLMTACEPATKVSGEKTAEKSGAPAKVSGPRLKEGELATITLTEAAETRLGIRTARLESGETNEVRRFMADVVLPPGKSLSVAAPVSGTLRSGSVAPVPGITVKQGQVLFELTPLLPLPRDLRVTAEADVDQAKTRVQTAKLRKTRADQLLKDEVGTVRAVEDAANELALAQSGLDAAELRLKQIQQAPLEGDVLVAVRSPRDGIVRQVLAAPGQPVNAGALLVEVADFQGLWLRMPVYAGEAANVPAGANVQVETLAGQALGVGRPVAAPPTGDPLAATVDFYYEAPRTAVALKPGERLGITVPLRTVRGRGRVPWSAVVFDINGGTWVYEQAANRHYVRHRVQLDHSANGVAYLASHPPAGTPIVIEGAAELWGVEFGAGK